MPAPPPPHARAGTVPTPNRASHEKIAHTHYEIARTVIIIAHTHHKIARTTIRFAHTHHKIAHTTIKIAPTSTQSPHTPLKPCNTNINFKTTSTQQHDCETLDLIIY